MSLTSLRTPTCQRACTACSAAEKEFHALDTPTSSTAACATEGAARGRPGMRTESTLEGEGGALREEERMICNESSLRDRHNDICDGADVTGEEDAEATSADTVCKGDGGEDDDEDVVAGCASSLLGAINGVASSKSPYANSLTVPQASATASTLRERSCDGSTEEEEEEEEAGVESEMRGAPRAKGKEP